MTARGCMVMKRTKDPNPTFPVEEVHVLLRRRGFKVENHTHAFVESENVIAMPLLLQNRMRGLRRFAMCTVNLQCNTYPDDTKNCRLCACVSLVACAHVVAASCMSAWFFHVLILEPHGRWGCSACHHSRQDALWLHSGIDLFLRTVDVKGSGPTLRRIRYFSSWRVRRGQCGGSWMMPLGGLK